MSEESIPKHPWADDAGGPAFPFQSNHYSFKGMTLRDYFAAKAMQALIANHPRIQDIIDETLGGLTISRVSYFMADAMLTERERRDEE